MAKRPPWMLEADRVTKEREAAKKADHKARGSRAYAVLPWRSDARYAGRDVIRWFRAKAHAEKFALGMSGGRGVVVRQWDQLNDPDVVAGEEEPKTTAQIRSEVSQLSELLADPAAARTFAREMRHELQKKQASERTSIAVASSPFLVMRMEGGRRDMVGRYRSEDDARPVADRVGGWIEHEGRIIYGRQIG